MRIRLHTSLAVLGAYVAALAAFGARLIRLEDSPIWWDEGWSVWLARQDLLAIAQRTATDEHPPLHYWLLHFWISLAGEDPFVLRFSSVFAGVLTVALLYRVGADLASPRIGLTASALLAISRFHVWWSQEVKMYSLTVFLALLSVAIFVRLLRSSHLRYQASYIVVTLACLMTSYLSLLVLAVQNGFLLAAALLGKRTWQTSLQRWAVLQLTLALLSTPWALYYALHAHTFRRNDAFAPFQALQTYLTVLPLGVSTNVADYTIPALAFTLLATAGIGGLAAQWWRRRADDRGVVPLESWLLPLAALVILPVVLLLFTLPRQAIYHPKVSERYMIVFLPMYSLALAYGLAWLWQIRKPLATVAAVSCGLASLFTLGEYLWERRSDHDVPAMAYTLTSLYRPGDIVVLNPDDDWPLWAYHVPVAEQDWLRVPYGASMNPNEAAHWLGRLSDATQTVWLITDGRAAKTDPRGDVPRWLSQHFPEAGTRRFLRSQLSLYSRNPVRDLERVAASMDQADVHRAGPAGIALDGVGPVPRRLRAGQLAYLFTTWSATAPTTRDYRARLVVRRENGLTTAGDRPWTPLLEDGHAGSWAMGETLLARHALALPLSTERGQYTVVLEVQQGDGQPTAVALGTVQVEAAGDRFASNATLTPSPAVLDGTIELSGFRLSSQTVQPGDQLQVDLRWVARAATERNATVFVHFSGSADDAVWASGDSAPGEGSLPTSVWSPGDTIDDAHTLVIPAVTPPGVYIVFVGMYDQLTGDRLAATSLDGAPLVADRIAIATVLLAPIR